VAGVQGHRPPLFTADRRGSRAPDPPVQAAEAIAAGCLEQDQLSLDDDPDPIQIHLIVPVAQHFPVVAHGFPLQHAG
jgi:hypothetical protein